MRDRHKKYIIMVILLIGMVTELCAKDNNLNIQINGIITESTPLFGIVHSTSISDASTLYEVDQTEYSEVLKGNGYYFDISQPDEWVGSFYPFITSNKSEDYMITVKITPSEFVNESDASIVVPFKPVVWAQAKDGGYNGGAGDSLGIERSEDGSFSFSNTIKAGHREKQLFGRFDFSTGDGYSAPLVPGTYVCNVAVAITIN